MIVSRRGEQQGVSKPVLTLCEMGWVMAFDFGELNKTQVVDFGLYHI